jgi:hypothetical protein
VKLPLTARKRSAAFATAAVFILLVAASALMLTTAITLRQLHKELRFVEKRQVQRWTGKQLQPAALIKAAGDGANTGATNAVNAPTRP